MDAILVRGGGPLRGTIPIAGAKNACLALMPATLLTDQPLTLTNAPRLSDIRTMTQLLQSLGAEVQALHGGQVLALSSHDVISQRADYDIVRKMRASVLVLGPLLARFGHAEVSLPGGCAIGARQSRSHHGIFRSPDRGKRKFDHRATQPPCGCLGMYVAIAQIQTGTHRLKGAQMQIDRARADGTTAGQ